MLSYEEAEKFIKDEFINPKRLEELVGNFSESMTTIYFVDNIIGKAKSDAIRMESTGKPAQEIYDRLDFYLDLLYVITDQMCHHQYPKERCADVDAGIKKLDLFMDKYRGKKPESACKKPEQSKPSAATSQQAQASTKASLYNAVQGTAPSSKAAPSKPKQQTSASKVWSTKDKNNIDRLLDNFNKRQNKKKQ